MKPMNICQLTKGFWLHLTQRRKNQLVLLLLLMMLASFAEVLSLSAVIPFLGILTQPERVLNHPVAQPIFQTLGIDNTNELLLPVTLAFIAATVLAGSMRILLLYVQTKLSYAIGADFSYEVYRRTLYQPYTVHVSRNSSDVISGVTTKIGMVISYLLNPILTLISSAIILIAILMALITVDPAISIAALVGFGGIYGCVILITRKRLTTASQRISTKSHQVIKVLQEGLGGIRDILIDSTQETYCQQYRQADIPLRHAQASSIIIGGSPRFAVEALGMAFIAALAYIMTQQDGGITETITLLGFLAVGAQRLLPILQQSYSSIILLRTGQDSLQDALKFLNQKIDDRIYYAEENNLDFQKNIELRSLSFRYKPDAPLVLNNIDLFIPHGSRTGFIGTTGSGKSTLLDIIMSLLPPTEGEVWIDDIKLTPETQRAWRRHIAHVPQTIYLSDASIAENIAFGIPAENIDYDRVRLAAQQAQIADHIESLSDGYKTQVGERGVRLSGGQRQRIGIARALYRKAEVIIFDEATSALDNETEKAVMDSIDRLGSNLTVLIIAHRLSTLQRCDQIVRLNGGRITQIGSYEDVIQKDFSE